MKKLMLIYIIASLFIFHTTFGQETIKAHLTFNMPEIRDAIRNSDYSSIVIDDCSLPHNDDGSPEIPYRYIRLIIPINHEVSTLEIKTTEVKQVFEPEKLIIPSQREERTGREELDDYKFIEPSPAIYESDNPYPASMAEVAGVECMSGNLVVTVYIIPFQYFPKDNKLAFYENIEILLSLKKISKDKCLRDLPFGVFPTEEMREDSYKMLYDIIYNKEDFDKYADRTTHETIPYINAFEADSVVWKSCLELNFEGIENPISETVLYGDTTINEVKWKIVTFYGAIKGLVRTEEKKVIFMPYPGFENIYDRGGAETVIYDFSLEVGDSFDFGGTVTAIDSVELNDGRKHKRLLFNSIYGDIEGLGNECFEPFTMLFPKETMASTPTLMCCHVNGELLYMNPRYLDCEGNRVGNEWIESDNVKIYVNNSVLHIVFADNLFDVALYNMNGMLIKQQKGNSGEALMRLSGFDKGIYVVRIVSGNKSYSQKIYNRR